MQKGTPKVALNFDEGAEQIRKGSYIMKKIIVASIAALISLLASYLCILNEVITPLQFGALLILTCVLSGGFFVKTWNEISRTFPST